MILEQATCGHFAAFGLEGEVLHRSCDCAVVRQPRETRAAIVRGTPIPCEKCRARGREGVKPTADGPHSPHLAARGGRMVLIDCAGEEISR